MNLEIGSVLDFLAANVIIMLAC